MLITLQEGCERIIRNRALDLCGLEPEELSMVAQEPTDESGLELAEHFRLYRSDTPTTPLKGDYPVGLEHWRSVQRMLDDVRNRYWLEIERDIDSAHGQDKSTIAFVDGIPEDPRQARVTRTSLMTFVNKHFPRELDPPDQAPLSEAILIDPDEMPKREKTLLKMLGLAARSLAKADPSLQKKTGGINLSSMANTWRSAHETGDNTDSLSEDTMSRAISRGLSLLKKL
jgi:hypothetical protein